MNHDDETPVDLSGLTEVPVPDQWEEILHRAAGDVEGDVEGTDPAPEGRRVQLAAAAVMVIVLLGAGLWLVAGSDDGGNLLGPGPASEDEGLEAAEVPLPPDAASALTGEEAVEALDGTWQLTSASVDGSPLVLPPGGPFILRLVVGVSPGGGPRPPGTWTFRACNFGSGSLEVDDGVLHTQVMGFEDMGCPTPGLHELDHAIETLLTEGARFEVGSGSLTLTSTTVTAELSSHDGSDPPLTDPGYSTLLGSLNSQSAPFAYVATVERTWTDPVEVAGSPAQGRLMAELRIAESWKGGLPEGSSTTLWYGTQLPEGSHPIPDVVSEPLATGAVMLFLVEPSALPGEESIHLPVPDGGGTFPIDGPAVLVDGTPHPIDAVRSACTACSGGGG